ncbi:MAG: DNA polymerase III subunit alpha [Lachnospiraceae bacterium]|nr:DNA polymerase III subunit alpha [Ruminococcus sp.]MCM1274901.1 DNA polymerase III subunit alpha [Lachnospiraceae bacterium]
MTNFVHLNVHTAYSLLNGACRLGELAAKAGALGQTALAITDSGALYGAVDFCDACAEHGIKPIIGCEVSVAEGSRLSPNRGFEPYRLTLLCADNEGYKNLCRLITEQAPNAPDGKYLTDRESLERCGKGLIALSGAENGEIGLLLSENRPDNALKAAEWYKRVFDGFYLELCNHDTSSEARLCALLRDFSERTGIPTCPTNNVHYVDKNGSYAQRVLQCIGQNKRLSEPNPNALPTEEYYLKSAEEMRRFFTEEELSRTAEIAAKCNMRFEFGVTKLPLFRKEGVDNNTQYFIKLCNKGAEKRYGTVTPEIQKRLDYELSIIQKMGFVDYFLIVWDFVRYAKSRDIPVGPGRGSGAGSLCAYCMGITDIDPLRFNLLFERFLNPERVSMPDFDIDFCNERRGEVIEYVRRRYGTDYVAQIVAFDTLKAKGAIRDAGRVMGVSQQTVNAAAKAVSSPFTTLAEELDRGELKRLYAADRDIKRLVDVAMRIEGFPRHTTVHAAGVVITRDPVAEYVPLSYEDGALTTQYTMTALERLGLLKMDFLGLRNLTVIKKTCDVVRKTDPDFDIRSVGDRDPEVYKMLSNGGTAGVFQFESEGMTSVLSRLQPKSLEDLTAALALYRPGPMSSIPTYIENRHKSPDEIVYKHPLLKDILSVTYGCIVYQEQVMQICRVVGGYSYGRADLVRRAMSKKKHSVMEKERSAFVYGTESNCGAVANGVPESVANEIFDEMAGFASYAFNKSHAAAYAAVAYQTAYLKRYHGLAYMAELISSVGDWTDKANEYISDAVNGGARLLPPDVNKSFYSFTVEDGSMRYGFAAVKNLGRNFVNAFVKERENGAFTSAADFAVRMADKDNNRRYMEALVYCGAFDGIEPNRRRVTLGLNALLDYASRENSRRESGQLDLFELDSEPSGFTLPETDDFPRSRRLAMEKEYLGRYISGHPADDFLDRAPENCAFIADALALKDGAEVSIMAMCLYERQHTSKNGAAMSFAAFEDSSGEIEGVVFPKVYGRLERFTEGMVYSVRGKISVKDDKIRFFVDSAVPAARMPEGQKKILYVNLPSEEDGRLSAVRDMLLSSRGVCAARICFGDTRTVNPVSGVRGVRISAALVGGLKKLCGDENVKVGFFNRKQS